VSKAIGILGGGFSSLSAACYLAKSGHQVTIYEKNESFGGRARGFVFDMGPTWYWMPDVFERFFSHFDKQVSDYYHLEQLDPGYQIYFDTNDSVSISANIEHIYALFEAEEKGSSIALKRFLKKAESNYNVAVEDIKT
jgi:phytoene desaturase